MATSAEGVQVNLPKEKKGKKNGTKAPATLNQFEINPAAAEADVYAEDTAPGCGWSAKGLWLLFLVGWVCPPCWWVGVVAGLRSGKDGEYLLKRRKKLPPQENKAWWACVIMSLVSALVLILVLAIYFGQKAPVQEGPFYLTLTGPRDAFPDLNDPTKMEAVKQAVKSALNLDNSYPLANINVWLDFEEDVTTPPPGRRLRTDNKVYVVVLGYSLIRNDQLPPAAELKTLMATPELKGTIADNLADSGFVTEEQLGKLQVIVTTVNKIEQLVQALQGAADEETTGLLLLFVPVGKKDCVGEWSAWTACNSTCGAGYKSKTFTLVTAPKNGGTCQWVDGQVETATCDSGPCSDCIGDWQVLTACNSTCGEGFQSKIFIVTTEAQETGQACEVTNGTVSNDVPCDSGPCPEPCVENWGGWGACITESGNFTGSRKRSWVIMTAAANGGQPCTRTAGEEESEVCHDCLGHFEDDGCVNGLIQQRYKVTRPPLNGAGCPHANGHTEEGTITCSLPTVDACPGGWSGFSACSVDCGTGTRIQTWTSAGDGAGTSNCSATLNVTMSGGGVMVNLTTGTINAEPCSTHACPQDCVWKVNLDDRSHCTVDCGSSTSGVFRGNVQVITAATNGGKCNYTGGEHVESTEPCTGCCTPDYDWQLVRDCPGSCFNNTKVFKWDKPPTNLPTRRHLLTGEPVWPTPPQCQPMNSTKQEECTDKPNYKAVDGFTEPQCCAYPGGTEGTRGQWKPSSDCSATCGTGIRNETFYVNPTPLEVDLADTSVLYLDPNQCIFNNTVNQAAPCTELQPCPVNCTGVWEVTGCSGCGGSGNNTETFTITKAKEHGGADCEAANGAIRTTEVACASPPPCANCTAQPPAIQNGTWQCIDGTEHGGICTGECDDGHSANGTLQAECSKGSYINITGNCAKVCAPGFEGASCTACAVGSYSEGGQASAGLTCTECASGWTTNATGSTSNASCIAITCPGTWTHGDAGAATAEVQCDNTTFTATCATTCKDGYTGDLTATCGSDGEWSTSGACTALPAATCPETWTPPVTDGAPASAVTCTNTTVTATCSATCEGDFTGSLTTTCGPDGQWSTTESCTGR